MKYTVWQTYTQTDVAHVEADSEENAIQNATDNDLFEDYSTSELDQHAEINE